MIMKKFFTLITILMVAPMAMFAQLTRTTVQQGEIEGVVENGFALYKAIPYAEAPVGKLRWKAPVPKTAWEGVYKTTEYAPRPYQPGDPNGQSEDCLYLSVQTPAKERGEKLPVFVMIHGGGFSGGYYAGTQDSFVREGIVYCSIEYRLGVLGFLVLPELTKEGNGLSGNYGILDQILALKWIHDNIAAFGGDPDKITICGESAGGISTSILAASPLCKGLFRAAISESGSSFWPVAEERGANLGMCYVKGFEKFGTEFMKKKGCKNLKEMRRMDAAELVKGDQMGTFWPVVDGYAILDDQYKLYQAGNYNDVNVLIGTNSDEGIGFTGPFPVEAYEKRMREAYGADADRLLKVYPATNEKEVHYATADIFRDGSFAWGTYAWANLQSQTGKGKVFMYYFDQRTEGNIKAGLRGAPHVAEMPFVYGWNWGPMTPTETHMSQIMSRYWINFTKTGDPNGDGLPYWTTYQQGKPTVMIMREGFHLDVVPNQDKMDFFEDVFRARRR